MLSLLMHIEAKSIARKRAPTEASLLVSDDARKAPLTPTFSPGRARGEGASYTQFQVPEDLFR